MHCIQIKINGLSYFFSSSIHEKFNLGDQLTAIAGHPEYGTSEPATNAVIQSVDISSPSPVPAKNSTFEP